LWFILQETMAQAIVEITKVITPMLPKKLISSSILASPQSGEFKTLDDNYYLKIDYLVFCEMSIS